MARQAQLTHYDILGVSRTASPEEIKTAYRTVVKGVHPDKQGTEGLFELVQDAYDTLSNPLRKREYDESLLKSTSYSTPSSGPRAPQRPKTEQASSTYSSSTPPPPQPDPTRSRTYRPPQQPPRTMPKPKPAPAQTAPVYTPAPAPNVPAWRIAGAKFSATLGAAVQLVLIVMILNNSGAPGAIHADGYLIFFPVIAAVIAGVVWLTVFLPFFDYAKTRTNRQRIIPLIVGSVLLTLGCFSIPIGACIAVVGAGRWAAVSLFSTVAVRLQKKS